MAISTGARYALAEAVAAGGGGAHRYIYCIVAEPILAAATATADLRPVARVATKLLEASISRYPLPASRNPVFRHNHIAATEMCIPKENMRIFSFPSLYSPLCVGPIISTSNSTSVSIERATTRCALPSSSSFLSSSSSFSSSSLSSFYPSSHSSSPSSSPSSSSSFRFFSSSSSSFISSSLASFTVSSTSVFSSSSSPSSPIAALCASSALSSNATATEARDIVSFHIRHPALQKINALLLPFYAFGSCRFSSSLVQRAVRELPWGSREDLLRDPVAPVYVQEKRGTTPRQEYNINLLDGIRVRPTVNPYVKLNKAKRYVLDNWPSRNWEDWTPYRCYVRGSRRRYNVPQDLFPYKDELGEWHPPRLSARYKADVKKQYIINGLPWVWEKDFYEGKLHFADRELLGPKRWYRRAFRRERVKEALRKMDDLVLDYRQEVRDRKKYDWFEKAVFDFAGEEMATQFIRKRVEPKF